RILPSDFEVALQVGVSVADTRSEAEDRFYESQVFAHMESLAASTLRGQVEEGSPDSGLLARNLVGTPDEVIDQVRAYAGAGVSTFAGLLFACNTVDETVDAMRQFS